MRTSPELFLTRAMIMVVAVLSAPILAASAELSFSQFSTIAKNLRSNKEVSTSPPTIETQDGELKVFPATATVDTSNHIYGSELRQLILSYEYLAFGTARRRTAFWTPAVRDMQRVIWKSYNTKRRGIAEGTRGYDRIMGHMYLEIAVERVLKRHLSAYARRAGMRFSGFARPAPQVITVTLSTSPTGGTIYLVSGLDWRIAAAHRKPTPWKVITQLKTDKLLGTYYYYIEWPDGKHSGKAKKTEIEKDGEVVLR